MKFDQQKFDESYGALAKVANRDVIDMMQDLANVLKPHQGENETLDKVIAGGATAQKYYNDSFKGVLDSVLHDFSELTEIANYLESANAVNDISATEMDYQKSGIDASAVM